MQKAERINKIPPYLFAEIDKKKRALLDKGVDVIDFGIGDPDQPTPSHIIQELKREADNPENHRYPAYEGTRQFREAVADYYQSRFGVQADPKTEVMALIGSKEGIAHIFFAFVDRDDYALVPDPGYPVYRVACLLAGGKPYPMPLRWENDFLPDLTRIPAEVAEQAKLMFLNYPNNPTGGTATLEFFSEVIEFAKTYDILVCHDSAYAEITYDGYVAPSILEVRGAKDYAVEFGSLSKPFNMTGWRIGYIVGNRQAVSALGIIKTNVDSGQFSAIQRAAIKGLSGPREPILKMCELYKQRRDIALAGLRSIGLNPKTPKGSFYLWIPVPEGFDETQFSAKLLEEAGVLLVPGTGYGECGKGYVRMSLTLNTKRLQEGIERIKQVLA